MILVDSAIRAIAATAAALTYTVTGMELVSAVESYKVLAQGQVANTLTSIYTASGEVFVKSICMANTSGADILFYFTINGTGNNNTMEAILVPANGMAVLGDDGWRVYDVDGNELLALPPNQFIQATSVAMSQFFSGL